jgi:hypothetical protein
MKTIRHGISIGIERSENRVYLSLKAIGKLNHDDYELITPMIDSAVEAAKDPIVNVYIDASEFAGWELRAAWDDLKLGLKHGNKIEKIAIYGTRKWQETALKIGSLFIAGEARFFDDADDALDWLDRS